MRGRGIQAIKSCDWTSMLTSWDENMQLERAHLVCWPATLKGGRKMNQYVTTWDEIRFW